MESIDRLVFGFDSCPRWPGPFRPGHRRESPTCARPVTVGDDNGKRVLFFPVRMFERRFGGSASLRDAVTTNVCPCTHGSDEIQLLGLQPAFGKRADPVTDRPGAQRAARTEPAPTAPQGAQRGGRPYPSQVTKHARHQPVAGATAGG